MEAGGDLPFDLMKLKHLKEELVARGSARSGLKAVLQRRLHSLLVEAWVAAHTAEGEAVGEADDDDDEAVFWQAAEAAHRAREIARVSPCVSRR